MRSRGIMCFQLAIQKNINMCFLMLLLKPNYEVSCSGAPVERSRILATYIIWFITKHNSHMNNRTIAFASASGPDSNMVAVHWRVPSVVAIRLTFQRCCSLRMPPLRAVNCLQVSKREHTHMTKKPTKCRSLWNGSISNPWCCFFFYMGCCPCQEPFCETAIRQSHEKSPLVVPSTSVLLFLQ